MKFNIGDIVESKMTHRKVRVIGPSFHYDRCFNGREIIRDNPRLETQSDAWSEDGFRLLFKAGEVPKEWLE